jgi:hypothetical protein
MANSKLWHLYRQRETFCVHSEGDWADHTYDLDELAK